MDINEKRISEMENVSTESLKTKKWKEQKLKKKRTIKKLWDNYKIFNKHNTTFRREKETEEVFEIIMTENFPRLILDTRQHIQKAQKTPGIINARKIYTWTYYFKTTENQR